MVLKHIKICSTSLIIRKMKTRTTPTYHLPPLDQQKLKRMTTHSVGEATFPLIAGRMPSGTTHLEVNLAVSNKTT